MTVTDLFHHDVDSALSECLHTDTQRQAVATALLAEFMKVRQLPVPDLPERLQRLTERMRQLVKSVRIGFLNGRLVVKATGSAESLLTELRHGSDWYAPWEKVDETLLAVILSNPTK